MVPIVIEMGGLSSRDAGTAKNPMKKPRHNSKNGILHSRARQRSKTKKKEAAGVQPTPVRPPRWSSFDATCRHR